MKKIIYSLLIVFVCLSTFACKKEKTPVESVPVSVQTPESEETPVIQEAKPEKSEPKKAVFSSSYDFSNRELSLSAFHTDAHKDFLDDPTSFANIPDQDILEGNTAVVASHICMFYPDEAFTIEGNNTATINSNIDDLGTPVPFATILPVGNKLENKEPENYYSGTMFHFQDNWNWFYKTEWQGVSGWVFGADLYGLKDTIENNRISSLLYSTGGKFDNFYPISGYLPLEPFVLESLENNRLAMQKVTPAQYVSIDDMIDSYRNLRNLKSVPIFITTDLAAHTQHLVFDRMLQYTEEYFFLPRMEELTNMFIEAISRRSDAPEQIREQAIQYFQVPQAIIRTGAEAIETGKYDEPVKYVPKTDSEIQEIICVYPESVKADYEKVMSADGQMEAIFNEEEDFSQYRPRGHYTKNGALETYFRATMWYGHLHFSIVKPKENEQVPEAILQKEAVISLIVDTVQKNQELYERWAELFNPITTLIGMSDDLSFEDIVPLWKEQNVSDYSEWASNPENLTAFMTLCSDTLRPPAISGQSVLKMYSETDPETGNPTVPLGWRLFGQRFTYDSFIHEKVSPPRLMSRDIVRGLDIMKVFGSQTAEALLQSSDYPSMPGLKEKLDELQNQYDTYDSVFWNQTYYNQILYQVKTQATFEQGAGFYFTESPAWNIKSQIAAHGTWAELRHDTILYVKQVAAERAGDGDFEPTFRTEPLPKPVHYIEPNVPFWEGAFSSVLKLMGTFEYYNLLDEESKVALERLYDIYKRILSIVKTEAANLPVSTEDIEWIPTIPASFGTLALVHNNHGYISDNNLLKMACIADVYTNNDFNVCLEVGVANPVRLYIPLNDSQGGKRIAIGYGFSYVEFTHPSNDRMTDDQWKTIIYKQKQNLDEYMPFWEKECLLKETTLSNFR